MKILLCVSDGGEVEYVYDEPTKELVVRDYRGEKSIEARCPMREVLTTLKRYNVSLLDIIHDIPDDV